MFNKFIITLFICCIAPFASALEVGDTLPPLTVQGKGELLIEGDKVSFKTWESLSISQGTPALIFHLAARMSSDAIIDPLRNRLDAKTFAPNSFQSISVVNLGDAMWGTSGLVLSELAKNKRAHPEATIVADAKGRGLQSWNLAAKSVAVILVDSKGKISYLKQGRLSTEDVDFIMQKLDQEIANSNSAS
ncbi:MAG: YtfJ family protein [Spongiibacteraceae bacterium]